MNSPDKKVAISQSNYVPWKGYFDLIASVDVFVIYDDMQYTKRDWRNRNKIKTPNGLAWLTIPVEVKGKYFQKINEVKVSDLGWVQSHWGKIKQCYAKSKHFGDISNWLEPLYMGMESADLSSINRAFIDAICDYLNITTEILDSRDFDLVEGKTERLVGICKDAQATQYISGPAARNYIEPEIFEGEDLELKWADYSGYPEYKQLWGDFEHGVTILDLLFSEGPDANKFMKHV